MLMFTDTSRFSALNMSYRIEYQHVESGTNFIGLEIIRIMS